MAVDDVRRPSDAERLRVINQLVLRAGYDVTEPESADELVEDLRFLHEFRKVEEQRRQRRATAVWAVIAMVCGGMVLGAGQWISNHVPKWGSQ